MRRGTTDKRFYEPTIPSSSHTHVSCTPTANEDFDFFRCQPAALESKGRRARHRHRTRGGGDADMDHGTGRDTRRAAWPELDQVEACP